MKYQRYFQGAMVSISALMIGLNGKTAQATCMPDTATKQIECTGTNNKLNFTPPTYGDGWKLHIEKGAKFVLGMAGVYPVINVAGNDHIVDNEGLIQEQLRFEKGKNLTIRNSEVGVITAQLEAIAIREGENTTIENKGLIKSEGRNSAIRFGEKNFGFEYAAIGGTVNNEGTITSDPFSADSGATILVESPSSGTFNITNQGKGQITGTGSDGSAIIQNKSSKANLVIINGPDAVIINGNLQAYSIKSEGGDDKITNYGFILGNISLANGNNEITNGAGTGIIGNITTGQNEDTIVNQFGSSLIKGNIVTGLGNDKITNSGSITGLIDFTDTKGTANDGDDTFINNAGASTGNDIRLGDGKNSVTNYGKIGGYIDAGQGNDTIVNGGEIGMALRLGDGKNTVTNEANGKIGVKMPGAGIVGGAGVDEVNNAGLINGYLSLGNGDNTVTNEATGIITGRFIGGTGIDTIENKGTFQEVIETGDGADRVINLGSLIKNVDLGNGNDSLELWAEGNLATGINLEGGAGSDELVLVNKNITSKPSFIHTVNNFEVLRKEGIGNWRLDNNYTFTTATHVNEGTLDIGLGHVLNSPTVDIALKGNLQGEGTVQGNVISSGSITAGNGTSGTLTVKGKVTVQKDSVVRVAVGPGLTQSKLVVEGDVVLGGNGTLMVEVAPGFYRSGTTYDVIETTTGQVVGQFEKATLPTANRFTQINVLYPTTKLVQVAMTKLNYNIVGRTYNQGQAGSGLFAAVNANASGSDLEVVAAAFEQLPNDEAMQNALDHLSGEGWAASELVGSSINHRLRAEAFKREIRAEGLGLWGGVVGGQDQILGDGNGGTVKDQLKGVVAGLEYGFDKGQIGVMVGYGTGDVKLSIRDTTEKVTVMQGSIYGSASLGGFEIKGVFSYGQERVSLKRQIEVGSISRAASGKGTNQELALEVKGGYRFDLGFIELVPNVGVEGTCRQEGKVVEKGGQEIGLTIQQEKECGVNVNTGLEIRGRWQVAGMVLKPWISGSYSREVMGKEIGRRAVAFNGALNSGGFHVRASETGQNVYQVGGGLGISSGVIDIQLGYSQTIENRLKEKTISANIGFHW